MQPSINPEHESMRNQLASMMASFEKKNGKIKTSSPSRSKPVKAQDFTITPPSIMDKRRLKANKA